MLRRCTNLVRRVFFRAAWEEISVQIFIPYERSFSLVFWEKNGWSGATPSTWNFGQPAPVGAKSPIFNRYSLVAPRPWHLAKKSSTMYTTRFSMSLRWSSYVASKSPQAGPQKRKTADLRKKNRTSLKESLLQFLCVKTDSGKVVRHSLA